MTSADGRETRQQPSVAKQPDGSTKERFADGTTVERMADGSTRDGTWVRNAFQRGVCKTLCPSEVALTPCWVRASILVRVLYMGPEYLSEGHPTLA